MASFLSPEWMADVRAALEAAAIEGPGRAVVVRQIVSGDGNLVAYRLVLGPGGATLEPGAGDHADVTLKLSRRVAAELATGRLATDAAIRAGAVRRPGVLVEHARTLAAVAAVAGGVTTSAAEL